MIIPYNSKIVIYIFSSENFERQTQGLTFAGAETTGRDPISGAVGALGLKVTAGQVDS